MKIFLYNPPRLTILMGGLLAGLLLFIGFAAVVLYNPPPKSPPVSDVFSVGFDWLGLKQVKVGMTRQEVIPLIGDHPYLTFYPMSGFNHLVPAQDDYSGVYCQEFTSTTHARSGWVATVVCYENDTPDGKVIWESSRHYFKRGWRPGSR